MRELTDRELDAVCGGVSALVQHQNINNTQTNSAAVAQSSGSWSLGNYAAVRQENGAINANVIVV